MRQFLVVFVAAIFAAAPALADDSALHKEGFWTVGRGDAEAKSCIASINAGDEAILLIQMAPGHVDFVAGTKRPMREGKAGVLTVGDHRFEFTPDYDDRRDFMFFEDVGGRALAAVRQAPNVGIIVDGREILHVSVENTGLADALDAVVACSEGKSGWWGPGVGAERLSEGPTPNKLTEEVVYNKEGFWGVAAGGDPGVCVAAAALDGGRYVQLLAAAGQIGLAVATDGQPLARGRRGRVEADGHSYDFKPQYGADSYMASAAPFDEETLLALREARWIRVTVDGRELVDVRLEGSGFPDVLRSVAACSRGEKGWWGEGAKQR